MNNPHPAKSPTFLRDQFILTAVLLAALVCRNAFVSSMAKQPTQASDPRPASAEAVVSVK